MKKLINPIILSNEEISTGIYYMKLEAFEIANNCVPGQFVEVYIDKGENILPRPISICDIEKEKGILHLVYKVVGKGTEFLSRLEKSSALKIIGSLGNGFPIIEKKSYALVGGGIGIPPLLYLCRIIKRVYPSSDITVFLGFQSETYLTDEFQKIGVDVKIATDDGSKGFKGNTVELIKSTNRKFDIIYSCGPKIMLKGIADFSLENNIECYVSMEERMACGIGACVGCVVKIKNDNSENGWEYKKVCKDGPVFNSLEVVWNE